MTDRIPIPQAVRRLHFCNGSGRRAGVVLAVFVAAASLLAGPHASAREILKIGVSYVPPEPRITDTRLYTEEGFELDLGRDIGKSLQREVVFIQVADGDRQKALVEGVVDLTIGSEVGSRAQDGRTFLAGASAGLSVAMRSDTAIRQWSDLRGKTVCIAQANERSRKLARDLGAKVREERAPARSLMWVRTGDCDAAIHEKPVLDRLFSEKNWQKFSATLPPEAPASLTVNVAPQVPEALAGAVGQAVSGFNTKEGWHTRIGRWAANVAFEVYLDQEAPDCHG
ncbi:hypothetical protein ACRQ1B_16100 [Rhizobium panacihumi]|uniref:hypothetical protein n=1 Tax=Rhizobium panacihumi TaxID=2008450 RepID=UPI003D7ACD15